MSLGRDIYITLEDCLEEVASFYFYFKGYIQFGEKSTVKVCPCDPGLRRLSWRRRVFKPA